MVKVPPSLNQPKSGEREKTTKKVRERKSQSCGLRTINQQAFTQLRLAPNHTIHDTSNLNLYIAGLSSGLSVAASQCFLASMTAVASLCDCSSKLRNVLLSSTKIVNLLLYQLQELRQVLNIDQVIGIICAQVY